MNYRFRTSGNTTLCFLVIVSTTLACALCAATPNTTATTTTTAPAPVTTEAQNEPVNITTTPFPEYVTIDTIDTETPVQTTPVQNVKDTASPASSSVSPIPTTTSSIVTDSSTSSVTSSPATTQSTPISSTSVPVPAPSTSTASSPTSTQTISTTSSTISTESVPVSSTTTQSPTSTPQAFPSSTVPDVPAVPSTVNVTEPTEPVNQTTTTTTTTPAPKPLISFDPATGLVVSEENLLALTGNGSKLLIKYVNKANDALQKQTQKFTFKSTTDKNSSVPQFVAKYLVKSVNVTETKNDNKFKDFMPDDIRNKGGVVLHVFLLVYVCLSLGIICDLYFLTSIEYIGNTLNLPADIAGATFMALGTSAPELFIALIGVFIAEDDIGTSTILGSAVFNLIFVPSVCGFAIYFSRLKYPKINKYSILRDAIFYIIAITTLLLALKDNEIDWIESTSMLCMYLVYVTILYYNAQLGELIEEESDTESETSESETSPLLQSQNSIACFTKSEKHSLTKSADWIETGIAHDRVRKGSFLQRPVGRSNSIRASAIRNGSMLMLPGSNGYIPIDPKVVIKEEPSGMPENWAESHWLLKIAMLPTVLLIKLTVPKPNKHNYFLTFIISILWISAFTYLAVWLVTIIGYTLQLPQTVLGLTILAAGSSIPEVISSVIVVKRAGLANMALCNLFGSNIFDILVCLGLPWLIKSIITMVNLGTTDLLMTVVTVQSNGLLLTNFTLILCVISFVVALGASGWKIGLSVGVTCSIIYFVAISLASVYEIMLN